MSHLVGNPEDRFSHNKAHILHDIITYQQNIDIVQNYTHKKTGIVYQHFRFKYKNRPILINKSNTQRNLNDYARFHIPSYHYCREMSFISRLDTNFLDSSAKFWQSRWSVNLKSRAPGIGACLKSVSKTITMQNFILPAITAAEKSTLTWIVDRWTNGRTNEWTKSWTPISHPAISRCYKKTFKWMINGNEIHGTSKYLFGI